MLKFGTDYIGIDLWSKLELSKKLKRGSQVEDLQ